jgi:hypothetical protein
MTVALALAVPAAAVRAPFLHAHPDEHATDHHAAPAVHAHFSSHGHTTRTSGPAIGDADHDRAVRLQLFVAVAAAAFALAATPSEYFVLPVPAITAAHRPVHVVHGHDPPALTSLSSRAPPRVPVLI